MTLTLDGNTFLETVTDIVAERGSDFVYVQRDTCDPDVNLSCSYVTSGNETPCRCLIGEVAHRHGVSDATLRDEWDGTGTVDDLCDRGLIHVTEDVRDLMLLAQTAQDTGERYGDILGGLLAHWDSQSNGSSN